MNKTFWTGFVAVYVVGNILGFLVHAILLGDVYTSLSQVWRPEEQMMSLMWIMYVTALVYVFLFCYIYTKGYEGKGVTEGLRYGLLVGLFVSTPMAFDSYVTYPITLNLALLWFITGVIQWMIAGGIFAAIYRK